jgi:hypothetical protein
MFTVWDPSNDGIDNDNDGAVDDADTGRQASDRCGPEVRVFGRVDLNLMSPQAFSTFWPDGVAMRIGSAPSRTVRARRLVIQTAKTHQREPFYTAGDPEAKHIGPFETIGDLLRFDSIHMTPGTMMGGHPDARVTKRFEEKGLLGWGWEVPSFGAPSVATTDDDGDGVSDERDERDMIFTWISNHITTRANVFDFALDAQIAAPPYYPEKWLPFKTNKTRRVYAHKQLMGVLDRSTTLRINSEDGSCDFTGPVELRLRRLTEDYDVY